MLVAGPGLDVESATLFIAVTAEAADATMAADGVEAADADPKPAVDPKVVCAAAEFPLLPPAELEALLTMPAAKEFKLAMFVFPMPPNWLFGS